MTIKGNKNRITIVVFVANERNGLCKCSRHRILPRRLGHEICMFNVSWLWNYTSNVRGQKRSFTCLCSVLCFIMLLYQEFYYRTGTFYYWKCMYSPALHYIKQELLVLFEDSAYNGRQWDEVIIMDYDKGGLFTYEEMLSECQNYGTVTFY